MNDSVLQENISVAKLTNVRLRYGKVLALNNVDLVVPAGCMVGLIGPDGVGKSSLLSLIAGVRAVQHGKVEVLAGDMASKLHRRLVCPHIAYMPQGLGKNLYETLSVEENLQFFGRLFGQNKDERDYRIDVLTKATDLYNFLQRPAGQLSGGMKQKLGLCCALIHNPKLLILDEPTTGVDPLSRNQFWNLIKRIRSVIAGLSIIVATAYMDEAERFEWLVAMDEGNILATGTPRELHHETKTQSLEETFIALLPEEKKRGYSSVVVPPLIIDSEETIAIEARNLTKKFDGFTAVEHVSFRIRRGEIFGFLGSNGCGKTTTMKMLTGLLPATEGQAWLFGESVNANDIAIRYRVGYMSQTFSLYSELSVYQNLMLHARLFNIADEVICSRVQEAIKRFGLAGFLAILPKHLPLGIRQRLSLAVAMIHKPEILILDEPTSGVDPICRDSFWQLIIELARKDKITVFISTHFMNEAERCDRISLMHAGKVLASDSPTLLIEKCNVATLEEAFIHYLETVNVPQCQDMAQTDSGSLVLQRETSCGDVPVGCLLQALNINENCEQQSNLGANQNATNKKPKFHLSISRVLSYALRELLELKRDRVRGILALFGSLILMFVIGYGINMDVENLNFAVLDRDQTALSNNYVLNLTGSKYFIERAPIRNYQELDRRMQSGELSLALEIPPGFEKDVRRGRATAIGAWLDGAVPQRAETARGYIQGMHQHWLNNMAVHGKIYTPAASKVNIETRFRYNPDVKSLPAMVPAVIPLLLLMIPAMLTALSVVREKELGSIINFYVTPVTKVEFLVGKQIPYVLLGILNFVIMVMASIFIFDVPIKGNFFTLLFATCIFLIFSTGFGLFASIFTRSQLASIFLTMVGTMLPTMQFAGIIHPVSALEGVGKFIGQIYPAAYFFVISRGVFTKALTFMDLKLSFIAMALAIPVIMGLSVMLLKKQEY